MSDQQMPMPPMSGGQRQAQPNYQQEILEGGAQRPPQLILSPEDKALFDECNRISFWQRSLPLGIVCASSVVLAAHRGLITKGVKLKSFVAGFAGFIIGKGSYASVLQDRFLKERPYSQLSQIIRKNRGMPEIEIPPEYQAQNSQGNDSDYNFQPITERPYNTNPSISDSTSSQGTSYDQLREEHQKRYRNIPVQDKEPGFYIPQHELARLEAGQNQPLWPQPEVPHSNRQQPQAVQPPPPSGSDFYGHKTDDERPRRKTTNKYGDEIYE